MSNLALFDLDHTLLPLDSDYEWGRFLSRIGAVDAALQERENERFYRDYQAGRLDIQAFLAFQLAPLAAHPPAQVHAWHAQYMQDVIEPAIRPSALALIESHRRAGDLCLIITSTNDFVTGPIAQRLGIEHLIATRVERVGAGYSGRAVGIPSFREGKVTRLTQWLQAQGRALSDFGRSSFYSDSINDLPLLEQVNDPVATNPDDRLAALARERGWRILKLFE